MSEPVQPDCQIYLITPPVLEPAAFLPLLLSALDAAPVAAVQLRLEAAPEAAWRSAIDCLRPAVQDRDVAFLAACDPGLAQTLGCDGAHLETPPPRLKPLRAKLGDDFMLGVSCGESRHTAMVMAEDGADYVSFGPLWASKTKGLDGAPEALETLAWWAEMMETPCVGVGGVTDVTVPLAARAGADFVAVVGYVWSHPDGPATALRRLHAALAGDGA